ncbi:hypothetical protein [Streptomyces sp. NPDC001165]|uniref:hypothetical protein n=1 Tax=Streptomyces sp. NPDC001165 TaxID=3364546 RepID=UPI0036D06001
MHVLVTLRPLARIMPSQWQQYVQNGLRMGYEDWLEHMLRKPPYEKPNPSFWQRHRHDRLVERWARIAGPERVTVVVVDDRDRGGLMHTFETLLGLPVNFLHPAADTANRSLTLAETEMLRNLNVEFRGNGLPEELYSRLVRNGAVLHMKNTCSPTSRDVKIPTPHWAALAAGEIGAEMAERIGTLACASSATRPCSRRCPNSRCRLGRSRGSPRKRRPGPCTARLPLPPQHPSVRPLPGPCTRRRRKSWSGCSDTAF